MKRVRSFIISILFVLILTAPASASVYRQTVNKNTKTIIMVTGEVSQITIQGVKASRKRTFKIWNESVVRVHTAGKTLEALNSGTTKVTMKQGKKKVTFRVRVQTPVIDRTGNFMVLRGTTLRPYWSSSNPYVAEIDRSGHICLCSPGETTFTGSIHGVDFKYILTVVMGAGSGGGSYTGGEQGTVPLGRSSNGGTFYKTRHASLNQNSLVWVPKTPYSKYHSTPECGNIDVSAARNISIAQALQEGYTGPCSNCFY